ncbi:MAG: hypothetical protein FWC70_12120 [Defluviitaleaceae bacterium]|nr:hypothetical protein [Defluviitaleaceae bacterium]
MKKFFAIAMMLAIFAACGGESGDMRSLDAESNSTEDAFIAEDADENDESANDTNANGIETLPHYVHEPIPDAAEIQEHSREFSPEFQPPTPNESFPPAYEVAPAPDAETQPPEPPVLPGEREHQLAAEFLRPFYTLYSFGWRNDDGSWSDWFTGEVLAERPFAAVVTCPATGADAVFDRFDTPFAQTTVAPWGYGMVPGRVRMFDISGDGMPEIFIRWISLQTCFSFYEVFRFENGVRGGGGVAGGIKNGAFKSAGTLSCCFRELFYAPNGRIVGLFDCGLCGNYSYQFLNFTADGIRSEMLFLLDTSESWDIVREWDEFHERDEASPVVFGTDIALTRIPRLDAFADDTLDYLRESRV